MQKKLFSQPWFEPKEMVPNKICKSQQKPNLLETAFSVSKQLLIKHVTDLVTVH